MIIKRGMRGNYKCNIYRCLGIPQSYGSHEETRKITKYITNNKIDFEKPADRKNKIHAIIIYASHQICNRHIRLSKEGIEANDMKTCELLTMCGNFHSESKTMLSRKKAKMDFSATIFKIKELRILPVVRKNWRILGHSLWQQEIDLVLNPPRLRSILWGMI